MKENNIQEIWKDIPGYEGLYQASSLGKIRSLKFNKVCVLKPVRYRDGYYRVNLYRNKVAKKALVHRLVWSTFNGPIPEGLQINHKDEVKKNNSLANLELVTRSQNCNYGTRNKRISEKNGKCVQMLDKNNNTVKTFNSLIEAARFLNKKSHSNISCCLNGHTKSAYGYKWKFEA